MTTTTAPTVSAMLQTAPEGAEATPLTRLACWAAALDPSGLPDDVVAAGHHAMLDTLGVMLCGAGRPLARQVAGMVQEDSSPGQATLVASGRRIAPGGAALANGTAAHQLDFDDTHLPSLTHASCIVLPVALAAGEVADADGADLLAGFVAGSEVTYAMGRLLPDLFWRGWWPSSVLASTGAAAAAARVMRLSADQTAHALALATSFAFGLRRILGTDANPLGAGTAAQAGMQAARLAARGVRAPLDAVEDTNGLARVFNGGDYDPAALDTLGTHFGLVTPGLAVKMFPACSGAQAGAQAMAELMAEHDLTAGDIDQVVCLVPPLVFENLRYTSPRTLEQAQFSMPFAIGSVIAAGSFGVEQISDDWLACDVLQDAMERVELLRADELVPHDWRDRYPEAAAVECRLKDGRTLARTVLAANGMPNAPLDQAQRRRKFMNCATSFVDADTAETLLGRFGSVAAAGPVRDLLAPLRAAKETGQ